MSILSQGVPTACLVGRRTSMPSTSLTRILVITLLAGFLPGVKATCWEDSNGDRTCNGLSNTARIVLGVVISLAVVAVIIGLYAHRRRRVRQANLAYIQQTQRGSGAANEDPYGPAGGPTSFASQPPPQAHGGFNSRDNYDPSTGFSPSSGPPPYYPPPSGVPPVKSYQK